MSLNCNFQLYTPPTNYFFLEDPVILRASWIDLLD